MIVLEVPYQAIYEMRLWHVISIEYRNELGLRSPQAVVDVSSLRVPVSGPRNISAFEFFAEFLDLIAFAVVEHDRTVRVYHFVAGEQCFSQDIDRFALCRYEDVDRPSLERRRRGALEGPPYGEVEEGGCYEPEELGNPERPGEEERVRVKSLRHPPEEVIDCDGDRYTSEDPSEKFCFTLRRAHIAALPVVSSPRRETI